MNVNCLMERIVQRVRGAVKMAPALLFVILGACGEGAPPRAADASIGQDTHGSKRDGELDHEVPGAKGMGVSAGAVPATC